jgi:hypothetical protein
MGTPHEFNIRYETQSLWQKTHIIGYYDWDGNLMDFQYIPGEGFSLIRFGSTTWSGADVLQLGHVYKHPGYSYIQPGTFVNISLGLREPDFKFTWREQFDQIWATYPPNLWPEIKGDLGIISWTHIPPDVNPMPMILRP